jgi:glycine hydroxymethyltransferase
MIDFKRFREIANSVDAFLLADISHISGLIIQGLHPNPLDHAHVTTTCTHKQLCGPRGGLIMCGKDYKMKISHKNISLKKNFQSAVFPFSQGAPIMNMIAAKARALAYAKTTEFRQVAHRIIGNAKILAAAFSEMGIKLVSGGTDTHIVMLDLSPLGITGYIAEKALEHCSIIVNKNLVPEDKKPASITSGIRIGTNTMAQRNFHDTDVQLCANLIHKVIVNIKAQGDKKFTLDSRICQSVREKVKELCLKYPIPKYNFLQPAN